MTRAVRILRAAAFIGLCATIGGLLVVLGLAFSETRADPSLSLEDGYWIGRLPWIAIGTGLVVAGSNTALVAGTAVSLIVGGWVRRGIVLLASAAGVAWWLGALFFLVGVGGCPECGPAQPDPLTMAYSLPDATVLMLVLPAGIAGMLGLLARSPRA
jgi:hypothetical protein